MLYKIDVHNLKTLIKIAYKNINCSENIQKYKQMYTKKELTNMKAGSSHLV